MAIIYTQTKLDIECCRTPVVAGRIVAQPAKYLTQELIDSGLRVPLKYAEAVDAVLYAEGDEIPEGKDIGDVKIPAIEAVDPPEGKSLGDIILPIKEEMPLGGLLWPEITEDEATEGFTVPAEQYMTHLNVEYTGVDDDTGISATVSERICLTPPDLAVEEDFVSFSEVTEAWVNSRVAKWYTDADVARNIAEQIEDKKADAVAVANPWE